MNEEIEKYIIHKSITYIGKEKYEEEFELCAYIEYNEKMPPELYLEYQREITLDGLYITGDNSSFSHEGCRTVGCRIKSKSYEEVKEKALALMEQGFEKEFNFRDEIESTIKIEVSNRNYVPEHILEALHQFQFNDNLRHLRTEYNEDKTEEVTTYEIIHSDVELKVKP